VKDKVDQQIILQKGPHYSSAKEVEGSIERRGSIKFVVCTWIIFEVYEDRGCPL